MQIIILIRSTDIPTIEFNVHNMPSFCPLLPQQENLTDCGIFLLQYIEMFFQKPINNFATPLESLLNWFPIEKVNNKRKSIAQLIRNLTRKGKLCNGNVVFPNIGLSAEDYFDGKEEIADIKKSASTEHPNAATRKRAADTPIPVDSQKRSKIDL